MKNKLLSLLMVATIVFAAFASGGYAQLVATMRVIAPSEIQELKVGEKNEYRLTIKNVGSYTAARLKVTIKGDHPFRSDTTNLTQDVVQIYPQKTALVKYNVTVSPLAKSKIYEFDVEFNYIDSQGKNYTTTEKAFVKIVNNEVAPLVSVVSSNTNTTLTTKEAVNSLNIKLRNDGTMKASNVTVTLAGMSANGVVLYNDNDTKIIKNLSGGSSDIVNFLIQGGITSTAGVQTLTVGLKYTDELGNEHTKEQQVFVRVAGTNFSDISIENISHPKSVMPDQDFAVTYTVKNNSTNPLKNMELTFTYPEAFIAKENSRVQIDQLAPGESKDFTVKMFAKKGSASETYHCYIGLSPVGAESSEGTKAAGIKKYVGIFLNDKEKAAEGTKPKLIVKSYSYGDKAGAGEEFDLIMNISNTSTVEDTRNIKITLSNDSGVFVPVDSSSSMYVKGIAAGETKEVKIRLLTKLDAEVKIYPLAVKMEYEDGKGNAYDSKNNPYSETESLSISVVQPVRLETSEFQMKQNAQVGKPFNFEIEYYNMGRATVHNLIIKSEGMPTNQPTFFVGNYEAGKSDYYQVTVTPEKEGDQKLKIIFEYEDALGQKGSVEKEFDIKVNAAGEVEIDPKTGLPVGMDPNQMGGDFPGGEKWDEEGQKSGGMNIWMYIGIAAGLLVLIVIVVVVLKKRKARRLEQELEEFDD